MCGGMEYRYKDPVTGEIKSRKTYFPIPKAQIPVLPYDFDDWSDPGAILEAQRFCRWGKRQNEDVSIDVPVTGWARLLSLAEGKWNRYKPKRVKIPAIRWMEKDSQRQSHWFDLPSAQCLLGVLLESQGEEFAYVVTRPATQNFQHIHDRMPIVMEAKRLLEV
ncbi:MAG TPA: hypothetical protein V6C99_00070 [Oculatellaceae cyanobacterium]|jgi:putative SOS response-associated peptidase YedK